MAYSVTMLKSYISLSFQTGYSSAYHFPQNCLGCQLPLAGRWQFSKEGNFCCSLHVPYCDPQRMVALAVLTISLIFVKCVCVISSRDYVTPPTPPNKGIFEFLGWPSVLCRDILHIQGANIECFCFSLFFSLKFYVLFVSFL